MNGKEALAVISAFTAIGGGIGAVNQFDTQADARARAIAAQTCETYDNGGEITKQTLDCLSQNWVPGGETVNVDLSVQDPEALLQGYVKVEKSRGDHFDASATLILGGLGLFVGAYMASTEDEKDKKRVRPERQPDEPTVDE